MKPFKDPPTIKDVAIMAGVSLKTVSRVINESEDVKSETREKVLKAISKLGYQPNAVARSLRVKKTFSIGVIIADITNSFYSGILRGIEDEALREGFSVLLANSDEVLSKEKDYVRVFVEKQVDGMIIVPTVGGQEYLENIAANLPVVFVDRPASGISAPLVKVDNEGGSYQLTQHLIQHGYHNIAFIGHGQVVTTQERLKGYRKALAENGIKEDSELIKICNKSINDAEKSTYEILLNTRRPQAIFSSNNFMLLGALKALGNAGVEVPRDIALVGFDDFETADTCRPRLTVVAQPTYQMGLRGAKILFELIRKGECSEQEVVLPTELIRRESCGCLYQVASLLNKEGEKTQNADKYGEEVEVSRVD